MNFNELYKMPEGANLGLRYGSYFDTLPEGFTLPSDMSYAFYGEGERKELKPFDWSKVRYLNYTFYGCRNLLSVPYIESYYATSMTYMFKDCYSLSETPDIRTDNCTDMSYMFHNCENLAVFDTATNTVPRCWYTSNVTNMNRMFYDCSNLEFAHTEILDTSNVTSMDYIFNGCTNLLHLGPLDCSSVTFTSYSGPFGYSELSRLRYFGGFINLKSSIASDYGLAKCPNLNYESCINVLNGLYDFTGNGETPTSSQGQLKVHQNFLDLVGDEISIANSKGWTITA